MSDEHKPMTVEELEAFRVAHAASTKGTWHSTWEDGDGERPETHPAFGEESVIVVSDAPPETPYYDKLILGTLWHNGPLPCCKREDAAFIVKAHNETPRLLATLAKTEAEREEARNWVRRMVNGTTVTCVYCGHAYPPGSPTHGADALKDHIRVCEKHPMREVEAELERLRAKVAVLEAETGTWRDTVKAWIDADVGEDQVHIDKLVEMVGGAQRGGPSEEDMVTALYASGWKFRSGGWRRGDHAVFSMTTREAYASLRDDARVAAGETSEEDKAAVLVAAGWVHTQRWGWVAPGDGNTTIWTTATAYAALRAEHPTRTVKP